MARIEGCRAAISTFLPSLLVKTGWQGWTQSSPVKTNGQFTLSFLGDVLAFMSVFFVDRFIGRA